ncbi:MAG: hypothetical protein ACLR8Y_15840 [Alistipes indistinctus]
MLYEERGSAVHGYTNRCYPSVPDESAYLKISYYDDYGWLDRTMRTPCSRRRSSTNRLQPTFGICSPERKQSAGVSTPTDGWDLGDLLRRFLSSQQSVSDLYPSGVEITSNTHNFAGQVTRTKVRQTVGDQTYGYDKWPLYDGFGRLLHPTAVDGDDTNGTNHSPRTPTTNWGNVAAKSIHGQTETETYAYDLNGRTSAVASPSFSYGLDYEQSAVTEPCLVDGTSAFCAGRGTTPDNAYAYNYDAVGQLAAAAYKMAAGGAWSASRLMPKRT